MSNAKFIKNCHRLAGVSLAGCVGLGEFVTQPLGQGPKKSDTWLADPFVDQLNGTHWMDKVSLRTTHSLLNF